MILEIVSVPYDSGHRAVRMGRGPGRLLEAGLVAALQRDGHEVRVTELETRTEPPAEVAVAFELAREIATAVAAAREAGRLPIVLAGNCFSAVGTAAGLGAGRIAALWLDAHGDLHTPDTTPSGFLDGMAVATLTGRCWRAMAASVPGFAPIPDSRIALIGARALDPAEVALVATAHLPRASVDGFRRHGPEAALAPALDATRAGIEGYYLHIDLDVLDPRVAAVNEFGADGGLTVDDVVATAHAAAAAAGIAGAALTAFDPAFDDDGRAARAAIRIARALAATPTPAR